MAQWIALWVASDYTFNTLRCKFYFCCLLKCRLLVWNMFPAAFENYIHCSKVGLKLVL